MIEPILAFLSTNLAEIFAVVAGAHVLALAIVNLTPTPKDNEVLERVYRVVETIGGVVTDLAKQPTPKQALDNEADNEDRAVAQFVRD